MKAFFLILALAGTAQAAHICTVNKELSLELNQKTVLAGNQFQTPQSLAINEYFRFLDLKLTAEIKPRSLTLRIASLAPQNSLVLNSKRLDQNYLPTKSSNIQLLQSFYFGGPYDRFTNTVVEKVEVVSSSDQIELIVTQSGSIQTSTGGINANGFYNDAPRLPIKWFSIFSCQKILQ